MPGPSSALKQRSKIYCGALGTPATSSNGPGTAIQMPRPANLVRSMKENRVTPFVAFSKEKPTLSQQQQQQRIASLTARIKDLELENSNLRKCLDTANNCRALLAEVHDQAVLSMQYLSKFAHLSKSALDELVINVPPLLTIAPVPAVALVDSAVQVETHVAAVVATVESSIAEAQPNQAATKLSRRTITLDRAQSEPDELSVVQHQLARHLTTLIESPDASAQSQSEPELMEVQEGQDDNQAKQCHRTQNIEPIMEVQQSPKSDTSLKPVTQPQSGLSENPEPVDSVKLEVIVVEQKQEKAKPKSRQIANLKRPIRVNRRSNARSSQERIVDPVEEQQGAPLQNPFIPRHRLARTPPKPGAAYQNLSMNSSNNVPLEDNQQTLSSPLSRQTLSPTETMSPSTPLLTKELTPSVQRRNCVGGADKNLQRRGTFVVKQQQKSMSLSSTTKTLSKPTPPASPSVNLCHASIVLIELQQEQSDVAELPSWPSADQAELSAVDDAGEFIATMVQPEVRQAPRPSMLPKRLSPVSATKPIGAVARRSSLALTSASNQTSVLLSHANISDSANTTDEPNGPAPTKRHRRTKKQLVKQCSGEGNVADEAIEEPAIVRPRRQRNAAVSYKEPSIHAKMRREDK